MNIIEEIEDRPRGIYSGAIGFIGLNGESDLNIVIRTAILTGGTVTVGSGGAIVSLSQPDEVRTGRVMISTDDIDHFLTAQKILLSCKLEYSHTRTQTHTHTFTHTLDDTHTLSLSLSLSHTHTHTHTHTHSHTHSMTLSYT